jgi:hypothetical protein
LSSRPASALEGIGVKSLWPLPALLRKQSQAPEARVALAADHQMVVDCDAQRFGRRAEALSGHLRGQSH